MSKGFSKAYRLILLLLGTLFVSACSLDASLTSTQLAPAAVVVEQRLSPDFISGEMVTSSTASGSSINGYTINGVFGEIGSAQTTSATTGSAPNYTIQAAFQ